MTIWPNALPPGTVLGWGLVITRVLGAGGFGITYEAMNRVTERRVAIKEFFPLGLAGRDEAGQLVYSQAATSKIEWALEKFKRTTTELARLDHPHILKVLDYMPGNNTGYMVMELLEGHTLGDWLDARHPDRPTPAELRAVFDPILDALAYVHRRGLIHRDIAPDNIILCQDGRPVLIDFGALSRDVSKQTRAAATVGLAKAHYTAPEQARADAHPEPTTDIYSIGAVLYRATMGVPPEDGADRAAQLALGEGDSYEPLAAGPGPRLPAALAGAIDACLALRKADRPQSIEELRTRLAWDSGRLVPAAPASPGVAPATAVAGLAALPPGEPPLPRAQAPVHPIASPVSPAPGALPAVALASGAGAVHGGNDQAIGPPPSAVRRAGGGALGIAAAAVLVVGIGTYLLTRPGQRPATISETETEAGGRAEIKPLPPQLAPGSLEWRVIDVIDRPNEARSAILQSTERGIIFVKVGEEVPTRGRVGGIERRGTAWVVTLADGTVLPGR